MLWQVMKIQYLYYAQWACQELKSLANLTKTET